ncbi:MAG TPA: lipopolysaccharide biosynthesis protein [Planctomycetota bacterium]
MRSAGLDSPRAAAAAPAAPPAVMPVHRGFLWLLAGTLSYMLCQWGMVVVLARWGSPDGVELGQFGLAIAWTAPIMLFTNMGLRRVFATDTRADFRFSDYLGLRLLTNVAALGIVALVVATSGFRAQTAGVVLAMGMAKAVEAVSDILNGIFQKHGRMDLMAGSFLVRGPLALAGLTVGFLATRDIVWGVVGMGAGWLAVCLFYDWPLASRFPGGVAFKSIGPGLFPPGSARMWGMLANLSLPLGVVALLTSLKASIPTWVIDRHLSVGAVGLFVALAYFHAASNRVVSALGEAASPRLARLFADGDQEGFARLLARSLAAALAISGAGLTVALLFARPLMSFFYGAAYAAESGVLVALMAAVCAANLQTVLDYAMTAGRQIRIQPYLYGAGALLLLLLCAALVPTAGLRGAAIALGAGSLIEMIASGVVVGRALSRRRAGRTQPILEGP